MSDEFKKIDILKEKFPDSSEQDVFDIAHAEISKNEIFRLCHRCHHVNASTCEIQRCEKCQKSFLPLKYFQKIHDVSHDYTELFSTAQELEEDDLIKGVTVLWKQIT